MNYLFYILCACPSLLNPLGILPLWIPLSLCLLNKYNINLKYPAYLGIVSLGYISLSVFSFLINSYQSKPGHLVAYFLFFGYMIPFFISYLGKSGEKLKVLLLLRNFALVSFLCLEISLLLDYILLLFNIDYADFLPAESNIPVISGFFSRPRGFYPEPTEASMALNCFFFLFIASEISLKTARPSIKKFILPTNIQLLAIIYVVSMMILRSASGIISVLCSLLLSAIITTNYSRYQFSTSFKYPRRFLVQVTLYTTSILSFCIYFYSYFTDFLRGIFLKFTLNSLDVSSFNRKSGFIENFNYFFNTYDPLAFLLGSGPGHASLLVETNVLQRGSTSWFLDQLTGFGFIGILIYFSLILYIIFSLSPNLDSSFRFWYLVALFAVNIHLLTNTGFYYPALPLILALPFVPSLRHKQL